MSPAATARCSRCAPTGGPSVCGGIVAGPLAAGSQSGSSFVTMPVQRRIDCYGVIVVVAAAVTLNEVAPDAALSVLDISDTFNTYSLANPRAVVGAIRDENLDHDSMVAGYSGAFACSPGYLDVGDDIFVTWQSDYPDADIHGSAMAFVLTDVANVGNGITADGIGGSGYGSTNPLSYTGGVYGGRTASFNVATGAVLIMAAAYPATSGWAPLEGDALGTESDVLSVHAGLIAPLNNGDPINPGCGWSSAPTLAVVNYRSIDAYV